jgi:DNA-binding transcriptional MerR regulator
MQNQTLTEPTPETLYGIGDVSKLCGIPAHTIRFWEKEFCGYLSPARTAGKQRRYDDRHIRQIQKIKKLLWTDRFSIQGAKRILNDTDYIAFQESYDTVSIPDTHEFALRIARFIRDQLTKKQPA